MEFYTLPSSFESLPIEIFWYPALKDSSEVILILKGLYGLHDPQSSTSWDVELVRLCGGEYNFVCINTARRGFTKDERSIKEAFIGKTFQQESDDLILALDFLKNKKVLSHSHNFHIVANSFGGTTLLGAPEIIGEAASIVMIGSGCGKSPTTTKPLLQTLFDESSLLVPLRSYRGIFAFVRGADDAVVPRESQDKIIQNAISASVCSVYTIRGARHDLTPSSETCPIDRGRIIERILKHVLSLAEK